MLLHQWDYEHHTNAERLARDIIANLQAQPTTEARAENESAITHEEESSSRFCEAELALIRQLSQAVLQLLEDRNLYDRTIHEKIVKHPDTLALLHAILFFGFAEANLGLMLRDHLPDILQQSCPDHYSNALALLKGDEASQREDILNDENKRKVSELLGNHINFSLIMYLFVDCNQHVHAFNQATLDLMYERRTSPIFHKLLAIFGGAIHGMQSFEQSFVERIFKLETTSDIEDFIEHDFTDAYNLNPERSDLERSIAYIRNHMQRNMEGDVQQRSRPASPR